MKKNILLVYTWYIPEYAGKGRLVYTSIYQYILVGVYTPNILHILRAEAAKQSRPLKSGGIWKRISKGPDLRAFCPARPHAFRCVSGDRVTRACRGATRATPRGRYGRGGPRAAVDP